MQQFLDEHRDLEFAKEAIIKDLEVLKEKAEEIAEKRKNLASRIREQVVGLVKLLLGVGGSKIKFKAKF